MDDLCVLTREKCPCLKVCVERRLCHRLHLRPVDEIVDGPMLTHFVGFRGEEYHSAVRAFGLPDFIHKTWDVRAAAEVAPNDRVVFAKYHGQPPSPYSFDDSNQPDDPAAKER